MFHLLVDNKTAQALSKIRSIVVHAYRTSIAAIFGQTFVCFAFLGKSHTAHSMVPVAAFLHQPIRVLVLDGNERQPTALGSGNPF